MKKLTELYARLFNEAGPAGRTLSWPEIEKKWPEASVAFDRDLSDQGGNASFRDEDGTLTARFAGGAKFSYDGSGWSPDKPVDVKSKHEFNFDASNDMRGHLDDRFSSNPSEYFSSLNDSMSRVFGRDWMRSIDSTYGRGSSKKMISDMWSKHWTDREAFDNLVHYYDVSQQVMNTKNASRGGERHQLFSAEQLVTHYPMRIGQKFDYSPSRDGMIPRTSRPMSPEDFPGALEEDGDLD